MIENIDIYQSYGKKAQEHLAMEEYLMGQVKESSGILFLWTNQPAVIIGRNQNPLKECDLAAMEADGVALARRKSGGGAVYQDAGNLNISFLCREEDYDVPRQTGLWILSAERYGIRLERNGRNDLLLPNGRKCSGMAFAQRGDLCLHHGTMLVNTTLDNMERYLTVSPKKLEAKGIPSVRSRVGNLCDYCGGLTVGQMAEAVIESCREIYAEVRKWRQCDFPDRETWQDLEGESGKAIVFLKET